MGLLEKGNRKLKLCDKKVFFGIAELKAAKEFRKFQALYEFLIPTGEMCSNSAYFEDEKALYAQEVLYDFRALAPNKNQTVQLC